jgi:hypothetical protein
MTKYIMIEIDGKEHAVIFPDDLNHDCMFEAVQYAMRRTLQARGAQRWPSPEIVSAGAVTGVTVRSASGRSESLSHEMCVEIASRPQDIHVINGTTPSSASDKDGELSREVLSILTKNAPRAKHWSPRERWNRSVMILGEGLNISEDAAIAKLTGIANEFCPGQYKTKDGVII